MTRLDKIRAIDAACAELVCEDCPYLSKYCFTECMDDYEIDEMYEVMVNGMDNE